MPRRPNVGDVVLDCFHRADLLVFAFWRGALSEEYATSTTSAVTKTASLRLSQILDRLSSYKGIRMAIHRVQARQLTGTKLETWAASFEATVA